MQDIEKFKKEFEALNFEFKKRLNRPEEGRMMITDGVMKPEIYFSNSIRLAWILKEPYDEQDGLGGDWSIFEMFDEGLDLYENQFKYEHKTTWHPIIYVSYSIFNSFKKWTELDYIKSNHAMCDILRQIAFINTQKLPSKGRTRTDFNDLIKSIENNSDLLKKQLELLNPNVFIFANTSDLYQNLLDFKTSDFIIFGNISYLEKDDKLFINAYHPAQRNIKREKYVNEIIEIIEIWSNANTLAPL